MPANISAFARRSRAPESVEPRKETNTVLWCAPNSQTYVILTMGGAIPGNQVRTMLSVAMVYVQQAILQLGDGVIQAGGVNYNGPSSMNFQTWNTNNHQQTYGVLGAAIAALSDYMNRYGYGAATFSIHDGNNEVGSGLIGLANQ